MKEYIEREAARDLMEQALADEWEIQYADDRLDEIPAADVEEVVRCKDCVPIICPLNGRHKSDNDYCSFGIPREEF
jgi:hypothetical protein